MNELEMAYNAFLRLLAAAVKSEDVDRNDMHLRNWNRHHFIFKMIVLLKALLPRIFPGHVFSVSIY